jgi:uncharacterized protein
VPSLSMRFSGLMDLARLPYFEARDGRLVLSDPALGPAIDMHTHLALSFGPLGDVDLQRADAPTQHYLPAERAFDLDVYINQNFSDSDLRTLKRDLSLKGLTPFGMRKTHTVPNLAREMSELGISGSVLLPIDLPFVSRNAERWLDAIAGRRDFVGFASVHPFSRGVERQLDAQVRMGARGLKIHPAVQMVAPDHPRMRRIYEACGTRGLPILFHCGPVGIEHESGRKLTQVKRYEAAIAEHPATTFVLGHSGALQFAEGVELARNYTNVYLELSSQSLTGLRKIFDEVDPARIVFGTDWPFYHQAVGLAKVFLLTEGNEGLRRAVLHDNAARLLKLERRQ